MKKTYKGNPFLNIRGILLSLFTIGPLLMFLILGIYPIFYPEGLIIALIISTFFYFLFSITLNYLIIDSDSVTIKNHFKPWRKRVIKWSEIKQVSFTTTSGGAKAFTKGIWFTYKDDSARLIFFAPFRKKMWEAIHQHLKELNISIKNQPKTSKDYWQDALDAIKNAGKK